MPIPRLFVDTRLKSGSQLVLGREEAHYLGRVLRLAAGEDIRIFNGSDGEFAATIASFGKDRVSLTVADAVDTHTESRLRIHLVQGISRGERMDLVVQKATELGVQRITPVLTANGAVKLDSARAERRREHWQRIARSACEQSGRIRPPSVDAPQSLSDWFGTRTSADSTELVLHPDATESLSGIVPPATRLCLLVGPEGGFSDREHDDAALAGFEAVSLGPRVLRTETAAIAAIAITQALWGDIG